MAPSVSRIDLEAGDIKKYSESVKSFVKQVTLNIEDYNKLAGMH